MNRQAPLVFDACQHFVEPPDLWTSRLPAKFRSAVPQVVPHAAGGETWTFDVGAYLRPLGLEVSAGQSPQELRLSGYTYGAIRKGTYDPSARIRDLDLDGIALANVFPTFALSLRHLKDLELQNLCVSAYNDAVAEFCNAGDSQRLLPHALMPSTTLDAALKELERISKSGRFKGIVFNGWPSGASTPGASDEAFWARCQETGMVLNMIGGGPNIAPLLSGSAIPSTGEAPPVEALWAGRAVAKAANVAWLLFNGIFEKFPGLKVALIETGAGWLPFYQETVDDIYRRARFWAHPYLKLTPSEYLQRQVYATIEGDHFAVRARHDIGIKNLLWASCYPTAASAVVWPSSRTVIAAQLGGIPEEERRRILAGNAAALYGVDLGALALRLV